MGCPPSFAFTRFPVGAPMALLSSHSQPNPPSLSNPFPSSVSLQLSHNQIQSHLSNTPRILKSHHCCCSKISIRSGSNPPINTGEAPKPKRKRNPRPSFQKLISEKWPLKNVPLISELPGRIEERICPVVPAVGMVEQEEEEERGGRISEVSGYVSDADGDQLGILQMGSAFKGSVGSKAGETQIDDAGKLDVTRFKVEEFRDESNEIPIVSLPRLRVDGGQSSSSDATSGSVRCDSDNELVLDLKFDGWTPRRSRMDSPMELGLDFSVEVDVSSLAATNPTSGQMVSSYDEGKEEIEMGRLMTTTSSLYNGDVEGSSIQQGDTMRRMQEKEEGCEAKNVKLAEKTVPEHELKRLRDLSLRMKERFKVGGEGVSQALVGAIHDKWKIDEVVKLKFEGPLAAANMRRIHQLLEERTRGLVIWSSGSSLVLFRGMTYGLDSIQSCNGQTFAPPPPDSLRLAKSHSGWSGGHESLPTDADTLPGLVAGYHPPFRLLPYGVRSRLRGKEITFFRRLARTMPPHFTLGRNLHLQGLAAAMVKLWEKSAIVKIAIKQGVPETCTDRMAEELKKLTGGTLLSMNKELILFHRGNDFMAPVVAEALKERESLTWIQHEEETRLKGGSKLINPPYMKISKSPLVAGTLAETAAAISHWGEQPTGEDLEKMMKESAAARQASLVKYLQKKLALAKGKHAKAEKALAKIQECLVPAELPSDLEIVTDEERSLLHRMGLSMKPYLLLGRRGVFDGTVQNMHLHWKFRELVKIIVKGKNIAQVKHIAISLEAESGGVLISIDKTWEGFAIILYRGKNYQRPLTVKPKNLLTKRQALARSIELQRLEALKHHIADLQEKIDLLMSSELGDAQTAKEEDQCTFRGSYNIDSDDDHDHDDDDVKSDRY
ncbi:hypothetical protein Dimus_026086 [Dionaea muscipula]